MYMLLFMSTLGWNMYMLTSTCRHMGEQYMLAFMSAFEVSNTANMFQKFIFMTLVFRNYSHKMSSKASPKKHMKTESFASRCIEHFDYDFAKCQNKIIYAILAIMTVILIWLFIKVYWKPKHQSMNFAPNATGRW